MSLSKYFLKPNALEEDEIKLSEVAVIYHGLKHHHSFLSMDCGSKLLSQFFPDSDICKKIRMGRTKIEALIQNVLAPYSIECLVKRLRRTASNKPHLPYSLSTDASNKGNKKMFPVAIKFFDVEESGLTDGLLNFVEQSDETSNGISNLLSTTLKEREVDEKFITAFSADNAPVNFGNKSSVYTKLREKNQA